jgi:TPR repeat protein
LWREPNILKLMDLVKLKAEAEAGSTLARSILGLSYFAGSTDVSQDYSEALRWLNLAASKGASRPLHYLGLMYEQGLGVERDLERAFQFHRRAADHGEETACIHVARMYRYGQGTPANQQAACEWYKHIVSLGEKGWSFDYLAEARDFVSACSGGTASDHKGAS